MTPSDSPSVRPFHRSDRDQVTALVNAHAAAVVPGASVSTAALLSQLEREPGEFITDPWVTERVTLVAQQRRRIVAAAHLQRYSDDPDAPAGIRDAGEIRWLLFWPDSSVWPGGTAAGQMLVDSSLAVLERWQVRVRGADGTLPVPGIYGVPEQWPHVLAAFAAAGFVSAGRTESVLLARVDELPAVPDSLGIGARRSLGDCGTRISAVRAGQVLGFIELDTALDAGSQRFRHDGLADIGNLWVRPDERRAGVGSWLIGQARQWLELGKVGRVLAYVQDDLDDLDEQDGGERAIYQHCGFHHLTRTVRDLRLP